MLDNCNRSIAEMRPGPSVGYNQVPGIRTITLVSRDLLSESNIHGTMSGARHIERVCEDETKPHSSR